MGLDPWPGLCQRSMLFATVGDGLWPCYFLARLAQPGFRKAFEIYPSSSCLSFLSSPGGRGGGEPCAQPGWILLSLPWAPWLQVTVASLRPRGLPRGRGRGSEGLVE